MLLYMRNNITYVNVAAAHVCLCTVEMCLEGARKKKEKKKMVKLLLKREIYREREK